jgi:RNA 2',3'-cyclic 3'-phosphodiesterase
VESRPSKARLFVALDLPDDARAELDEWRRRALGGREDLRLVDRDALHVTLVFLGHLPEEEIERIAALVRDAVPAGDPPLLRAKGLAAVPPRRPRLFALDLEDHGGRAGAVQAAVSDALEAAGLYEPEKRPFWPHVTLARVKKNARAPERIAAPAAPADPWTGAAVTLYRSRLSPQGARYEPLNRVQLPA